MSRPRTTDLSPLDPASSGGPAPADPNNAARKAQPTGFALVARRIASWTSNLLVSALILVIALGVGREVIRWWRVPEAPAAPDVGLGSIGAPPLAPFALEFGDAPYAIENTLARGDRDQAQRALVERCRAAVQQAPAARQAPLDQTARDAEAQLLAAVGSLAPLAADGQVSYYGPDAGLPMIVAIMRAAPVENTAAASAADAPQARAGALLGASSDRVLVWAIATPAGPDEWSLYTFRPATPTGQALGGTLDVELPPACARTMSLRDARGQALLAFAGNGDADEWRRWFMARLETTGWRPAGPWRQSAGYWQAGYTRPTPAGETGLELGFGPAGGGRLSGLLRVVPPGVVPAAERGQQEQASP